jgi:hypothetical protein
MTFGWEIIVEIHTVKDIVGYEQVRLLFGILREKRILQIAGNYLFCCNIFLQFS